MSTRALYPDASLADLYDENTMSPELRKAHQNNNRTVIQTYGFSIKDIRESKCVVELMKMYQNLRIHNEIYAKQRRKLVHAAVSFISAYFIKGYR